MHYVYAISCKTFIKIGVAADVARRHFDLQCASPFELFVEDEMEFHTREAAFMFEAILHEHLMGQRVRGEWFKRRPVSPLRLFPEYRDAYARMVSRHGVRFWESDTLEDEAKELGLKVPRANRVQPVSATVHGERCDRAY